MIKIIVFQENKKKKNYVYVYKFSKNFLNQKFNDHLIQTKISDHLIRLIQTSNVYMFCLMPSLRSWYETKDLSKERV